MLSKSKALILVADRVAFPIRRDVPSTAKCFVSLVVVDSRETGLRYLAIVGEYVEC